MENGEEFDKENSHPPPAVDANQQRLFLASVAAQPTLPTPPTQPTPLQTLDIEMPEQENNENNMDETTQPFSPQQDVNMENRNENAPPVRIPLQEKEIFKKPAPPSDISALIMDTTPPPAPPLLLNLEIRDNEEEVTEEKWNDALAKAVAATNPAPPPTKKVEENRSLYQQEEADDPDDLYRPEGTLFLEIDHFSDFARGPPEHQQRLSKSIYVRGIPWKILAIPRDQCRSNRNTKALGFFLQCNGDTDALAWNCIANATLKVLSKKQGIEDHARRITHTFYPKENDWGYSQFMNCDHIADPTNGYIENDSVTLSVHVTADAPHGVMWDSKKHTGYIGLKNQGATCYMNSILQTLFFTNALRKAVYAIPTDGEDPESSVALAMQRVFYDLQYSDKPVGTKKLTKSFGWDSFDSFLQHDVQELCRVLLDNIESKMKGTKVETTIPRLFQGKMKSYIKCTDVPYESSRVESFYDVQLNIRGKNDVTNTSVMESFRDYTEPEKLDGDNKYDAGSFGLQPALKGVKFLEFPPILHLQLMRFQYDGTIDANVKINEKFEFPDKLVLNDFVENRNEDEDYTYVLHAVLVHSGDFHGGHYVVYINTDLKSKTSRWCKFDDDVVSRSTFRDAVTGNYGGEDHEVLGRTFTNAYMLVYVRQKCINDVLCPVLDCDIPESLRERLEKEKEEEAKKKKEKMEAHLYTDIYLLTIDKLGVEHPFDLFDPKIFEDESLRTKVEKAMTIQQLYEFARQKIFADKDIHIDEFRLWQFVENAIRDECTHSMSLPRQRPAQQIVRSAETATKRIDDLFESEKNVIFVEAPVQQEDGTYKLADYNEKTDMLMFFKYYDAKKRDLIFCGNMMVSYKQTLESIVPECLRRAGIERGVKLRFYEEIAPDRIRPIESQSIPLCSEYMLAEVNDGSILIFERIDETTINDNAKTWLEERYSRIDVEVFPNTDTSMFPCALVDPEDKPFNGQVSLNWYMTRLAQYVGEQVGHDPNKILLWRSSPFNDKPQSYVVFAQLKMVRVKDLLQLHGEQVHDPRKNKKFKIFYNRIPVPMSDMERRRQLKVFIMDDRFNLTEATVFPEKDGTVANILEEARRIFKFAPNGTGELRLVSVGVSQNSRRVQQIFSPDDTVLTVFQRLMSSNMSQIRVEEIPQDQLIVKPNEHLLPVSHFEKEPTRTFGVPFHIKVSHDEPLTSVRERLRERLDVNEKEFEKYKFALLSGGRIIRYLEMDAGNNVNLSELGHVQITPGSLPNLAAPYLGIDHFNRHRTARGAHGTEKPIIIHN